MRKMKKAYGVILLAVIILMSTTKSMAYVWSSLNYTAAGTTDTYKSSAVTTALTYSSTLDHVCSGDLGINIFWASDLIGLSTAFVRDTSRLAHFKLYERDLFSTLVHDYNCHFVIADGLYRPAAITITYSAPYNQVIEDDGTVELWNKFMVDSINGDSSTAVTAKLMAYRYWTN